MIQNITPHRFDNHFYKKSPKPESHILYFQDQKTLLVHAQEGELRFLRFQEIELQSPSADQFCYLFSIDGQEYYLADSSLIRISENSTRSFYDTGIFRTLKPQFTAFAGITGYQLYRFYNNRAYCGRCGQRMLKSEKERAMICPVCHCTEYPKISPAIIVAITDGDRLLLSKYAGRAYTRYALIAGFTEVGETLEETVKREVMEEVGLKVKNITYYKNQPWSFTDSLLVGFFAELDGSPEIHIDQEELSLAEWVSKADIPAQTSDISLTSEMIERFRNS